MARSERAREATLRAILAAVARVPRGRVATYGQLAAAAGLPGRARLVGWALRRFGEGLPWWRVVGAGGRISPRGDPEGEEGQRARLRAEGVHLDRHGRVDLRRSGWRPAGFARVPRVK